LPETKRYEKPALSHVHSADLKRSVGPIASRVANARELPRNVEEPGPQTVAIWLWAALAVASLGLAVIGRANRNEALALIGGYGVLFFGIGGAPLQLCPRLDLYARLTGSMLVGFSLLLAMGMLMADIRGLWDPAVGAIVVAFPAVGLHVAGLYRLPRVRGNAAARERGSKQIKRLADAEERRFARSRSRGLERHEAQTISFEPPRMRSRGQAPRAVQSMLGSTSPERAGIGLLLIGTICWLVPAIATRDPNPSYWGMLTVLSPAWYAGLVLVLVGFALGRRSEMIGTLSALSFGLATTLTPALVYGAPREPTAAKQMQIAQYVLLHHHIHVTEGIYQAFSSLFAGIALLSQLLGLHGMLGHMSLWGLATYWPVMLVLLRVAVLRFLIGRLIQSTPRRWCGVMLVLLVDSLGNDYFSPQSLGYVLAIGIVAFAINGRTRRPLGDRATFALLLLAGIALGPMHELSPYMATGALVVLAIFGQAPAWTYLPVGVPALLWASVVHKTVSSNLSFSSLFNLGNFTPPVTLATPGLHRMAVVGVQSKVLLVSLLIMMSLAGIGFVVNVGRRWAWAYALCPAVGIAFIAVNPYGNEGIFRATLFAIPWMAVLAMHIPGPSRWLRPLARHPAAITAGIGLTLCTLLGTFVIAAYAMDGTMVLSPHTIAVVDYLDGLPRHNFVLSVGSANDPAAGANFTYDYTPLEWTSVAQGHPELQRRHPTAFDARALRDHYRLLALARGAPADSALYLIWDHSAQMYENAYGLQSTAETNAWRRVLLQSPAWKLVRRSGDSYLFRLI
jgi:hypothetical protein